MKPSCIILYTIYLLLLSSVLKENTIKAQLESMIPLSEEILAKRKDYKMKNIKVKEEFKKDSEYEFSRSISLQLDLLNMLTFTSVPSKLIGITSTVISQSVNMKHNYNIRNVFILTMNLSSDISTFSPVLNIIAKGNKITTNIKEWSLRYFTLWSTSSNSNAIYYQDSFRKIYYDKMDIMTDRDCVNIINGIILSPSIYQEK